MRRQYRLMSSDGHLEVPPERWSHRVAAKYRDRAPRTVHLPDGGDALMIEGQPLLEANFLDLRAGRAEGTWQPFGIKVEDAAGTGSPEQLAEEYCAVAPDRLIGMGVLPITSAEDAVAEMAHCARLGLKGVLLGALPNGKGYPTQEDDRFWAAAVEMGMPVTVHVQFSRTGA